MQDRDYYRVVATPSQLDRNPRTNKIPCVCKVNQIARSGEGAKAPRRPMPRASAACLAGTLVVDAHSRIGSGAAGSVMQGVDTHWECGARCLACALQQPASTHKGSETGCRRGTEKGMHQETHRRVCRRREAGRREAGMLEHTPHMLIAIVTHKSSGVGPQAGAVGQKHIYDA